MENVNKQLLDALKRYLDCDPTSTFGGDTPASQARTAIAAAEQAQQADHIAEATEMAQQAEPVAFDVFCTDDDALTQTIRATDVCRLEHYRKSPRAWRLVPLYAQPPAVAVPDEMESVHDTPFMSADTEPEIAYRDGWNACRDAMLAAMEHPK